MNGHRLPDTKLGELPDGCDTPGTYWKYLNDEGEPIHVRHATNLTGTMWGFCSPIGGIGTLAQHTVREHDDGTISVRAGDGSSNSIAFDRPGREPGHWHGYIERGVWAEV